MDKNWRALQRCPAKPIELRLTTASGIVAYMYRPGSKTRCALLGSIVLALVSACATTSRFETITSADTGECVVLLHGLNRSWRAMRPMATALQENGFTTTNVDYPSRAGPIEELVSISVRPGLERCRNEGAHTVHFVTHSIGGILLRYEHERSPISDLGRVVMLAPPNQGSEVVDKTANWPGAEWVGGKAGVQLGTTGDMSIPAKLGPVDFELGVIAGTGTINPWMSAMLPDPDDGKVSVASTRVSGMDDFLIVDNNHRTIVHSETVIANTLSFLKTGEFLNPDPALE